MKVLLPPLYQSSIHSAVKRIVKSKLTETLGKRQTVNFTLAELEAISLANQLTA
jgi:hypothetical protein